MAWLSRVNFTASDVLSYTDLNNLGNDIRAWGGNVNGGAYTLSNVILSASSGTMATVIGGTGTTSTLTLRSTSGVGTTGADIVFETGNNGATEVMRLQNSGNVRIGVPPSSLQTYQANIVGPSQATAALTDAGNKGGSLFISDSGSSADNGGALLFGAQVANGAVPQWAIKSLLSNGSDNGAASLAFSTRANTSDANLTERMRISSSGNVSIGNTDNSYKLDVTGTAGTWEVIRIRNLNSGNSALIRAVGAGGGSVDFGSHSTADTFVVNTGGSERMRIDSSGNVGIGTSSTIRSILNTNVGTITGPAVTAGLTLSATYSGVTAVNSIDWNYSGQTASPVRLGATFNSDGSGMEMVFYTSTDYTVTGAERMRLDKDGRLAIGTSTPATSARLEIAGTTGALLVPRLTTTERNALTAVNGMIIYNTTDNQMQGRINGAWVAM